MGGCSICFWANFHNVMTKKLEISGIFLTSVIHLRKFWNFSQNFGNHKIVEKKKLDASHLGYSKKNP
jgi:hypothetical protein